MHPDGTVRWLSARGYCFYGDAGQARRMVGVMRDVTEPRQARELHDGLGQYLSSVALAVSTLRQAGAGEAGGAQDWPRRLERLHGKGLAAELQVWQAEGALGLRWRLFDFGRIDPQIELARGREAEALAACRLAVLHAAEDVENAFSSLAKREEQAATLAQAENALGHARAASVAAYRRGAVSLVEVLQADESMLRASDVRVQARAEAARAAVAAFRALGGGWQPPAGEMLASSRGRP